MDGCKDTVSIALKIISIVQEHSYDVDYQNDLQVASLCGLKVIQNDASDIISIKGSDLEVELSHRPLEGVNDFAEETETYHMFRMIEYRKGSFAELDYWFQIVRQYENVVNNNEDTKAA